MNSYSKLCCLFVAFLLISCGGRGSDEKQKEESEYPKVGSWLVIDPELKAIVNTEARAEVIATGFDWSEGPLWLESENKLIFSDVPTNTIFQWKEGEGTSVYLKPSGYTGEVPRGGEMGSNGLTLNREGQLVLCQHGNRQVAVMLAGLDEPKPDFLPLASGFKHMKFDSPNDAVFNSKGELFFTDPPYGLEQQTNDPKKEIRIQGVYMVGIDGEVRLATDDLTRPNGIAFLPDESTLIVANSDLQRPIWYVLDRMSDGSFAQPRVFYDASDEYDGSVPGLPDGLKVTQEGTVFATGPGGLWLFNQEGKLLGKYIVPDATSNCALSPDEKTLYITNDGQILRLRLKK